MVKPMADLPQNSSSPTPRRTARERTSPIVERNVRALVQLAAEQERAKSTADRIAMAISRFAGSMKFVYFHAVVFGLWAAADVGWLPGIHSFDPALTGLNTVATVEAIFLATFVLIAQNRLTAHEEIQSHLDMQVGLLTEHETTHILRLVAAMGDRMGIAEARDPEIEQLVRNVEAQEMLDQIEINTDAVEEEIKVDEAGKKQKLM
jgi:uncharacterized membrane protein